MSAFDPAEMIARFRDRAAAARDRALPPVTGEGRRELMKQREIDYTDYSIVGAAEWVVEDGFLVLRVDMRPPGSVTDEK